MIYDGPESIAMAGEYDLGFELALSHNGNKLIPDTIYFLPEPHIVRSAVDLSKVRSGRTLVLDAPLTRSSATTDWSYGMLNPGEYDVKIVGSNTAIRGYYFSDINVALMCDITHEDSDQTRAALEELAKMFKTIREDSEHYDDGVITISGSKVFITHGGSTEVLAYAEALQKAKFESAHIGEVYARALSSMKEMYDRPPELIHVDRRLAKAGVSITSVDDEICIFAPIDWITDRACHNGETRMIPFKLDCEGVVELCLSPKDYTVKYFKLYTDSEVFHMLDGPKVCYGDLRFTEQLIVDGVLHNDNFVSVINTLKSTMKLINIDSLGAGDTHSNIWYDLFHYFDSDELFTPEALWNVDATWRDER